MIIGYNTVGGSTTGAYGAGDIVGSSYLSPGTGTIYQISAYVTGLATNNFKIGIYDDNGGVPDNLLGVSAVGVLTTTPGWVTVAINVSIVNGATYHFCTMGDSFVILNYDTTGNGNSFDEIGNTYPNFPATSTPSSTYANTQVSIYGDFYEAGGAAIMMTT